jgi:hypothetical protein
MRTMADNTAVVGAHEPEGSQRVGCVVRAGVRCRRRLRNARRQVREGQPTKIGCKPSK